MAVAYLVSPELLLQPLSGDGHPNDRPVFFTVREIQVARVVLALVGVGLGIAAGVWRSGRGSEWRASVEKDYAAYLADSSRTTLRPRLAWPWFAVTLLIVPLLAQTMRWSLTYHGRGVAWYNLLVGERGLWETLTAVTLFLAGVLFVYSALKFKHVFGPTPVSTKPGQLHFRLAVAKWPPLLLGVLLIVGAGEEVSWGQVWLGFATPEVVKAVNDQGEFNLHNIATHWTNHLMVGFFLSYVGVLPLLAFLRREVSYVVERLNVPLCSIAFAPFAFVGVSMSEAFREMWGSPLWRPDEARETLFGVLMLGLSVSFHLMWKGRAERQVFKHQPDSGK